MTKGTWEDIFGVTHDETPTKTWNSFMECIMFHLQQVFRNDAGKALIILPWGKYSYLKLPIGVACSLNIFQAKMSELMGTLEFI